MTAGGDEASAAVAPSIRAGEVAQARVFAEVLRQEVARLTSSIAKAEAQWLSRCEVDGDVEPPARLKVVQERMNEAERMLKALDTRYLRPTSKRSSS